MPEGIPKKIIGALREDINEQKKRFSYWKKHEEKFDDERGFKPHLVYDGSSSTFEYSFRKDKKNNFDFEAYFKERFSERMGELVGVELGGPGSNFFGSFDNIFERTLGITIKDLRSNYQTLMEKERDEKKHHSVAEADVFSKNSLKVLDKWLSGHKVDFIIERIQGGWGGNVESMPIFAKYFARYYERLGDNGCMLLQTPFVVLSGAENVANYNTWRSLLKQKYGSVINIDASEKVIKIEKIKGSPQKISTLRF